MGTNPDNKRRLKNVDEKVQKEMAIIVESNKKKNRKVGLAGDKKMERRVVVVVVMAGRCVRVTFIRGELSRLFPRTVESRERADAYQASVNVIPRTAFFLSVFFSFSFFFAAPTAAPAVVGGGEASSYSLGFSLSFSSFF